MKSQSVTIQMRAIKQFFPAVCCAVTAATFESAYEILSVTINWQSVDKDAIVKCDHSNKSYCGKLELYCLFLNVKIKIMRLFLNF